jgi:hypothetical protein
MKFTFGFLGTMMLYHASFLSSGVKGGGCGDDDAIICGTTPIGQDQFFMLNEDEDCEVIAQCATTCFSESAN